MAKSLHIPSLDGLRAISFGIVFVAHAGLNNLVPGPFGVTVFFFLSGYLITTLMRTEHEETGTISFRRFYLRRVLRILPPFYIVLLLSLATTWIGLYRRPLDPGAIWALFLHYANYYVILTEHIPNKGWFPPGTGVFWSLAVEEHFYLVFPLVFSVLMARRLRPAQQFVALLVLGALVLAWRTLLVVRFDASFFRSGTGSDTRFDSMLFGCALAVYENPALEPSKLSERVWKWLLFPLGLLGLLVCFAVRNEVFRETVRYSIQGLSLIPVFVCAIRYPTWLPIRPLNWRPLAFIGTLSYSLYLLHQLVLEVVFTNLTRVPAWAQGVLGFVISFSMAWVMWQVVEKPCARLRRRLHA